MADGIVFLPMFRKLDVKLRCFNFFLTIKGAVCKNNPDLITFIDNFAVFSPLKISTFG